jgi:hypothetical protein
MLTAADFDRYYQLALVVCTEAYGTKTRADKVTPYVTHPVEVARRMKAEIDNMRYPDVKKHASDIGLVDTMAWVIAMAIAGLGHDVKEDNPKFPLAERLLDAGIPKEIVAVAMITIDELTNLKKGTYLEYLLNLRDNGTFGAQLGKKHDMGANYDDTDGIPSKGMKKGLQTKYSLGYYILFGEKIENAPRL